MPHIQKLIGLLSVALFYGSCTLNNQPAIPYELSKDNGIFIEKPIEGNKDGEITASNNNILLEGTQFTYDYFYQDIKGKKYKLQEVVVPSKSDSSRQELEMILVSVDSMTDKTIHRFFLEVDHVETEIEWLNRADIAYYIQQLDDTRIKRLSLGYLENEKNVLIYPPWIGFLRVLSLNPLPIIQAPYEVGHKWEWNSKVGAQSGDSRWKEIEETVDQKHQYEITGKRKVPTPLGDLECLVITSSTESSLGSTGLKAFFHADKGFVKLEYTNIDSSKIVFELIDFKR